MKKLVKRPQRTNSQGKLTDTKLTLKALNREYSFNHNCDFDNRVIRLTGEIEEGATFKEIDAALTALEAESRATITVRICSPGGDVYEALAIVGRLRASKCRIITEGYGAIMSAATLILACGDRRLISKYSWFMYHEASYELIGRHSEMKQAIRQMEREEKQWAKSMAMFTKKTEKFWYNAGENKDTYFDAEQLVKHGVAEEVF